MKRKALPIITMSLGLGLLSSCAYSYYKPIGQNDALSRIDSIKNAISENEFSYSNMTFKSDLNEYIYGSSSRSLTLRNSYSYVFTYAADPFSLEVRISTSQRTDAMEKSLTNTLTFSKDDSGNYVVSENGGAPYTPGEKESQYNNFYNMPTYLKNVSQTLVSYAYSLLDSVGNSSAGKENKLTGYRTMSKDAGNMDARFYGSEFNLSSNYFHQSKYRSSSAISYEVTIDSSLVKKYSSNYEFEIEEATEEYDVGSYLGEVTSSIAYE